MLHPLLKKFFQDASSANGSDLTSLPKEIQEEMDRYVPDDVPLKIPPPPPIFDPLSLMLDDLCLKTFVARQSCLTAPWGLEFPGLGGGFYVVQEGLCFTKLVEARDWIPLNRGDLIIFPHRKSRVICDHPDSPVESVFTLISGRKMNDFTGLQFGGGGQESKLVHGMLMFEPNQSFSLVEALPDYIHVPHQISTSDPWLGVLLGLIDSELRQREPGSYAVVNQLVKIILIKAIQRCWSEFETLTGNCLSALTDPKIAVALGLIHRHPHTDWSVQKLADEVEMSRSAFAELFTRIVGKTPIAYLFDFRMHKAAHKLAKSNESIKDISRSVGYHAVSTFSAAFKRRHGTSPGAYRSQMQGDSIVSTEDES